ncbi:hypothetical protein [Streptomyces fildesensis]|uniref:hypothetical protein n=1 Tax=Streptomyces fildesensis TaxID=375757 RepID=UPI0018E0620B|nr:hypothetical protein [Streptomyces fildesensis]
MHTDWWRELWRRHAHIITPLRQRGLQCDIVFGLSSYLVHVSLPDDSYLIIGPLQEPSCERPPGDPEGWIVTRQHQDRPELFDLIYDSVPPTDPGAPERPEVRHGGSTTPMIEAIDQRLTQLRLLPVPLASTDSPSMSAAAQAEAPEPPAEVADSSAVYVYGNALLALTDQLNGAGSHAEAAALLHQILDPINGLLERLGEFFEAAGEKAKEAQEDDGFDLSYDLADAACEIRNLGEVLHVAEDRMRALTAQAPASRPTMAPARTPRPPASVLPPAPPRHTR